VFIAAGAVVLSIVSSYLLMQRLGPAGIALGASVAALTHMTVQLSLLRRRIGPVLDAAERRRTVLVVLASAAAAAAGLAVARLAGSSGAAIRLVASWSVFGAVFLGAAAAAGHPEARRLTEAVVRRLGR
jgi:peptidoglycan biosynthesis protein MviN/MurJ (putative lipid II flippase)